MPKEKDSVASHPAQMRWSFGPDIPTHDFFEERSLDDSWNLQEAVDNFGYWLANGDFQIWEAVVCNEQDLPLTFKQKELLESLLDFNDDDEDQILYIDGIPRASEPWHVILNKIVPYLLIEPYRTFDCQEDVKCDGWRQIIAGLSEYGQVLSLPVGVKSAEQVVDAELRHKLWLQLCFDDLDGLGQEDSVTLEDPEEHYRIECMVDHLRECKESVAYFNLNLASLLDMVILPIKDRPIFLAMMQDRLGLSSAQEPLIARL